jgi:hypothetical protein
MQTCLLVGAGDGCAVSEFELKQSAMAKGNPPIPPTAGLVANEFMKRRRMSDNCSGVGRKATMETDQSWFEVGALVSLSRRWLSTREKTSSRENIWQMS